MLYGFVYIVGLYWNFGFLDLFTQFKSSNSTVDNFAVFFLSDFVVVLSILLVTNIINSFQLQKNQIKT